MELSQRQLLDVVNTAVVLSMSASRQDLAEIARFELPALMRPIIEKDVVHVRRHAVYTEPPRARVSNYAQVLMEAGKWKLDKGICLASVWMCMPGKPQEFLFIEQFGQECAVMRMDKGQPKAVLDSKQYFKIIVPGKSIWTDFIPAQGLIDDVVARQKAKGWEIYQSAPKRQLELVDAL